MSIIWQIFVGALIGVANVIPGVSGGTVAVIFNVYQQLVGGVSDFAAHIKKGEVKKAFLVVWKLLPLVLGLALGVLLFSKVLKFLIENYPIPTQFAFMGLIAGTVPMLKREADLKGKANKAAVTAFIVTLVVSLALAIIGFVAKIDNPSALNGFTVFTVLKLVFFGFMAAGAMVIPGISGSLILMLLGGYLIIINAVSSLTNLAVIGYNLAVLAPFAVGVIIGIFVFSILIDWLLEKHYTTSYYGILGFVIGSIACVYPGFNFDLESYLAFAIFAVCLVASYLLTRLSKPKQKSEACAEAEKEADNNDVK